jgi:hypothetical protein
MAGETTNTNTATATTSSDANANVAADKTKKIGETETTKSESVNATETNTGFDTGTDEKLKSEKSDGDREIMKRLQAAEKELKKYQDAEKKQKEDKLKEQGEYTKLIEAKDKELAELKERETKRTKIDNIKSYLKENKIDQSIIDSKLPESLVSGDYFGENLEVKKDSIKQLKKDFPFLEAKREPTAQIELADILNNKESLDQYSNAKSKEIRENPALLSMYTGQMDIAGLGKVN